jgi:acyl carrier protein
LWSRHDGFTSQSNEKTEDDAASWNSTYSLGEQAMHCSQIQAIILDALHIANQAREDDQKLLVSPDAQLFGDGGQLDSMGLVALIIDIEEALREAGYNIILTNERAMSRARSPFNDVPSLVAYIEDCLAG